MDLIFEGFAPDALSSLSRVGWIASLDYEVWDYSEELCLVIVPAIQDRLQLSNTEAGRLTPPGRAVGNSYKPWDTLWTRARYRSLPQWSPDTPCPHMEAPAHRCRSSEISHCLINRGQGFYKEKIHLCHKLYHQAGRTYTCSLIEDLCRSSLGCYALR